MKKRIFLNGVYCSRAVKGVQELLGVTCSFDLDPRSTQFVQQYVIDEIVQDCSLDKMIYSFKGEQDFVIKELVDKAKKDVSLSFSCQRGSTFYSQFNCPYYYHYQLDNDPFTSFHDPLLKGIILSAGEMSDSIGGTTLQGLRNMIVSSGRRIEDLEIGISINRATSLKTELFQDFPISFIQFNISAHVEVCYRNVHIETLISELKEVESILGRF